MTDRRPYGSVNPRDVQSWISEAFRNRELPKDPMPDRLARLLLELDKQKVGTSESGGADPPSGNATWNPGCGTMTDEPICELLRDDEDNVFVLVDGMKIAKRGLPDTAHAMTWIMLEPGWIVRDVDHGNAIEVRFEGARIH
jgi:hypothetical protein